MFCLAASVESTWQQGILLVTKASLYRRFIGYAVAKYRVCKATWGYLVVVQG
jgi:hypothetical protein